MSILVAKRSPISATAELLFGLNIVIQLVTHTSFFDCCNKLLYAVASPGFGARGAEKYTKIFVARKMTRNNALNEVRVAATELPQLLSQNTTRMWANAQRDGRHAEYRWRPLFNAAKFG